MCLRKRTGITLSNQMYTPLDAFTCILSAFSRRDGEEKSAQRLYAVIEARKTAKGKPEMEGRKTMFAGLLPRIKMMSRRRAVFASSRISEHLGTHK